MSNDKARRVMVHKGKGMPLRMYLPGGGVDRSDECYDDPNGTHYLVDVETWERVEGRLAAILVIAKNDGQTARIRDIANRALEEIGGSDD